MGSPQLQYYTHISEMHLWYFVYLIGLDVHVFQIQIYYCEANHTVTNYFSLYFVKCSPYQNRFQIVINVEVVYIL